ncbi:MAG: UDP-N-acetylmuramate dehydrogenase [Candidatus Nealsonbacteria bacterium]|nr:UDP-N-acetylmuramate dehydrogenase [Candidatus Nealsonbacteria bacterium]
MLKLNKMNIIKELPAIKKNVSLAEYTTFKIGGKAKYFFIAKTKEDLIKAIFVAKKLKLQFFILGGGSNLLVSDKGYNGLVIKTQNSNLEIRKKGTIINFFCGAGAPLAKLVLESIKNSAQGLEWAAGIPGTVGGAIFGNAGAFNESMSGNIEEVEVLDVRKTVIKKFKNKDCRFEYRKSFFKKNKNIIILSAKLKLKNGKRKKIKEIIKEHLEKRKKFQPLNYPSAGSVFVNPKTGLKTGEMIEKCGLKGKRIGKAKVSEKHANFIMNLGKAKEKDVKKLINLIKKRVKNKFGVILKEEIISI